MKKVLITGGTGTLGKALAKKLKNNAVIFSRNESQQVQMKMIYPDLEYIIGDVRDYRAVKEATKGIDIIYHFASIKHVSICEQQPFEALKTNVYGTANVVKAAKRNGCNVIFMSTDKAENPLSFYGITKLMAERFVLKAGFTAVRSGNIFGSSGSVIPLFISQAKNGIIKLTDGDMTRFFILDSDLCDYILRIPDYKTREKLIAPHMSSFTMRQVAEMTKRLYGFTDTKIIETGANPGEKMHESVLGLNSQNCLAYDSELKQMFESWRSSLT